MGISPVKSLHTPLRVNNWALKVLIGGCMCMIPVANLIVMGYCAKSMNRYLNGDETLGDYSDLKGLFVSGFRLLVGTFLFLFPFGFLCLLIDQNGNGLFYDLLLYFIQPVVMILNFGMYASFAFDGKILSMFNFRRLFNLMKGNWGNMIYLLICYAAIVIIYLLITLVCCLTIVGAVLVPFIIYCALLSIFNLSAQLAVKSPNFDSMKSELKSM